MLLFPGLVFVLGTGMNPFLASTDDDNDQPDPQGEEGPQTEAMFRPKVAIAIGVLAALFCMAFFLVLYGRQCKHILWRLICRHETPEDPANLSLTPSSACHHRLSSLRLPYDTEGLSQWLIDALPKLQTCSASSQVLESQGVECPVCLTKYSDGELLRLLPRCKHAFHVTCIDKWLLSRPSCPICRTYVCCQDVVDLDNYHVYKSTSADLEPDVVDVDVALQGVEVVVVDGGGGGASPGEEAQAERRNANLLLSFGDHAAAFLSPVQSHGQLRRSVSLNALAGHRREQACLSPPFLALAPASEGVVHSRPSL